jgi:primosomal replication protein N
MSDIRFIQITDNIGVLRYINVSGIIYIEKIDDCLTKIVLHNKHIYAKMDYDTLKYFINEKIK